MQKTALILILLALFAHHARAQTGQPLGNPIALVQSGATENSHVFKAAGGYLYSLSASTSGTAGYVMVDDATALPSDGAVTPKLCFGIGANSNLTFIPGYPIPFGTGITAVFSTTGCFTQTKSATAFFSAQVK